MSNLNEDYFLSWKSIDNSFLPQLCLSLMVRLRSKIKRITAGNINDQFYRNTKEKRSKTDARTQMIVYFDNYFSFFSEKAERFE